MPRAKLQAHVAADAEFVICNCTIERSFAWLARFRRLARDYERLPQTVKGLHFVAFALLLLSRALYLALLSA
jgi:hypothetical protein